MDTTADLGHGQGMASYSGFFIALYQLTIMFVLPLLLMIVCYSHVIKELWLSTKKMSAMTRDYSGSSRSVVFHTSSSAQTVGPSFPMNKSATVSSALSTIPERPARQPTAKTRSYSQSRSRDSAKQARKQVRVRKIQKLYHLEFSPALLAARTGFLCSIFPDI